MFKAILITLFVSLGFLTASPAQNSQRVFEEANAQFSEANKAALTDPTKAQELYGKAILKYQLMLDQGVRSPALHINLANAYFQSGQNGYAVLHYQRAISLDPTNADATHNLKYLRGLVVDELPPSRLQAFREFVTFWHDWPFTLRLSVFVIANVVFWMLAARLFSKRSKIAYTGIAITSAVALVFGISLLSTVNRWDNSIDGVVVEREIIARQGNGMIYANAFDSPLHTGTEFGVMEKRDNWFHVQLLNNETCWLPENSVELVR
ncbi:tetratricopeptide repeat protein [Luteolibacter sp. AS25]|uniref:tetratricopeptide repeat protein n=1 Tax=Luteolibacter sp. AS25 TaxID=3135776 RepID=UPI00398B2F9A